MCLIETRRISQSDGNLLRDLHLRMYADSPDAFSESLAAAQVMTAEQWDARATIGGADAGCSLGRDGRPRADRLYRRLPWPLA